MLRLAMVLGLLPLLEPPPPAATRGLLELAVVLVGAGKWPALAIAVGAGLVAYNNKPGPGQDESVRNIAIGVASFAGGWFIAGLFVG
jgi:hypothetical protein